MRLLIHCCLAIAAAFLTAAASHAATSLEPGGLSEFNVELPLQLRQIAGHGTPSSVAHALVTIAVPANFDAANAYPVMVISATSDAEYRSSRRLLGAYADAARQAGWILVAADAAEVIAEGQDDVGLRYALNAAALAALASRWPGAAKAPLAFGGFSGGAKYSGWLAAAFASQGRSISGIYLAGINADTIVAAARHFDVLDDRFRRIPVFLQSGENDELATPDDHRAVYDGLKRAGFKDVRVKYVASAHEVDPAPLRAALDWFRGLNGQSGQGR